MKTAVWKMLLYMLTKCIFGSLRTVNLRALCLIICKLEFVTASDMELIFLSTAALPTSFLQSNPTFLSVKKWKCLVSHPLEMICPNI